MSETIVDDLISNLEKNKVTTWNEFFDKHGVEHVARTSSCIGAITTEIVIKRPDLLGRLVVCVK